MNLRLGESKPSLFQKKKWEELGFSRSYCDLETSKHFASLCLQVILGRSYGKEALLWGLQDPLMCYKSLYYLETLSNQVHWNRISAPHNVSIVHFI